MSPPRQIEENSGQARIPRICRDRKKLRVRASYRGASQLLNAAVYARVLTDDAVGYIYSESKIIYYQLLTYCWFSVDQIMF